MKPWIAAIALFLVGIMQMAGDLLRVPALKGIGAATTASPAPKVFSSVRGLETYSTQFYLEWNDKNGLQHSLPMTRDLYLKLQGPYNRRNIYGAILAYGPVLAVEKTTKPMFNSVLFYAVCKDAPLLRELGINTDNISGTVRIRYEPLPGTDIGDLPHMLEANCQ
jgi:hypothetical protein